MHLTNFIKMNYFIKSPIFTVLLLLTSLSAALGQKVSPKNTSELTGQVLDISNNKGLSFASVTLLKKEGEKTQLTAGATADENGNFKLSNVPLGEFVLRVSFISYKTFEKAIKVEQSHQTIETILLSPDANVLQEVQVKGEKDAASFNMDKRVFSVGKNLTSIGGTAEALLKSVPSVSIDETGSASIRNLATTIYINGKPTQLTLAQIPANQIESVEVVSNPSARYDATTSGGIINLVLKKNREAGYNGMASVGIGNNGRYDASLNLDYHQNKWTFNVLYNLNATKNPLTGYVDRTTTNRGIMSYFQQNTDINQDNTFQNGRISTEFSPNKYNTFTLAGNLVGGSYNTFTNQSYAYKDAQNKVLSSGTRTTVPANNYTNFGIEFDWKKSFAQKGKELSLMTSFTKNTISNAADWLTTSLNADNTSMDGYPEIDKITGSQAGSQYLFQLDYTKPINDSTKIEMGIRSFNYTRDIQYLFNKKNNDTYTLLEGYSQDGVIKESVNAAYFMYSTKLKRNYSIQGGLRFEESFLHGNSRFDGATFGYDYPSAQNGDWIKAFFPSFSISKKLGNDSELGLSLGRKVGRPNFRHLFVGIQANDKQNITVGNPKVQPEFVNSAELSYNTSWGHLSWLATGYYIYEDHTIKPFTQASSTDSTILVTTFINTKADIQYGIDNTLKLNLGNLSVLGNINAYHFLIQSVTQQNEMFTYRAKLNISYKFPKDIVAQINLNRDAKSPTLQGYRKPIEAADFAIKKMFMNNRASIAFAVNDIFNSRQYITVYDQGNIMQSTMNRREVRFYKLTIQLPIGQANSFFKKKSQNVNKPDIDFSN